MKRHYKFCYYTFNPWICVMYKNSHLYGDEGQHYDSESFRFSKFYLNALHLFLQHEKKNLQPTGFNCTYIQKIIFWHLTIFRAFISFGLDHYMPPEYPFLLSLTLLFLYHQFFMREVNNQILMRLSTIPFFKPL